MFKPILFACLLAATALQIHAQNVRHLFGQQYENLNHIKGYEHYKPIKAYNVFDEMICYRYQDTLTFQELMIFEQTREVKGQTLHLVADVLKIEGTNRYKILSVGANRFAAYSEKNIIIAVEAVDTSGNYTLPKKSITIYNSYTLEHKGHKFVAVRLKGLYRVGNDYYKMRTVGY